MAETILNLIDSGADDAVALAAPDRDPMTYAGLRTLAGKTVSDMNALGIGRNDRGRDCFAEWPGDGRCLYCCWCRCHDSAAQSGLSG